MQTNSALPISFLISGTILPNTLPGLEIESIDNSTNRKTTKFLKHVEIIFDGLENIERLGVKVDNHYILQQEGSGYESSILHTFFMKKSRRITIYTKHFSKFQICCEDHEDEPAYDSILLAALFGKWSLVEGKHYVDLKVVLDTTRTNREVSICYLYLRPMNLSEKKCYCINYTLFSLIAILFILFK